MGYRIEYDLGQKKRYIIKFRWERAAAMTAGCLALFGLLTNLYWPAGARALREFLIPGDTAVTGQAFEAMVEDIRSGTDISDAVTVFCREILEHAESSS